MLWRKKKQKKQERMMTPLVYHSVAIALYQQTLENIQKFACRVCLKLVSTGWVKTDPGHRPYTAAHTSSWLPWLPFCSFPLPTLLRPFFSPLQSIYLLLSVCLSICPLPPTLKLATSLREPRAVRDPAVSSWCHWSSSCPLGRSDRCT